MKKDYTLIKGGDFAKTVEVTKSEVNEHGHTERVTSKVNFKFTGGKYSRYYRRVDEWAIDADDGARYFNNDEWYVAKGGHTVAGGIIEYCKRDNLSPHPVAVEWRESLRGYRVEFVFTYGGNDDDTPTLVANVLTRDGRKWSPVATLKTGVEMKACSPAYEHEFKGNEFAKLIAAEVAKHETRKRYLVAEDASDLGVIVFDGETNFVVATFHYEHTRTSRTKTDASRRAHHFASLMNTTPHIAVAK